MKRFGGLLPILAIGPALGGCALQMAMAAAQMASNVPGKERANNAALKPQAVEACTAQAKRYGTPFVIDVEQRRADLLIVWGSVTDGQQHRRSFECRFTTKLASFKLREIGPSK
jgi:hypothetical protein